jgi:CRP-like cAMP-binding protein
MADGEAMEVASVGYQGMLGISVALQSDPAPYDMICQVPGEAMRLARSAFEQLLEELPTFRGLVMRFALCLFHEVARTAACNRLHTVEQRLARWLLECSHRATTDVYPLTHLELAQMLGVRRSYVTRTAVALQQSGLIDYHRGMLRIVDRRALEAIACEDYAAIQQEYSRLLA